MEASYWFWGILVGFAIVIIIARVNDDINKENAAQRYRDRQASLDTDVLCAKCDQYLGNGIDYDMPCPRCGSNRYVLQ